MKKENWLATTGWAQPLFPPWPVTSILHLTTIKSFRNESFLHQRYVEEGAQIGQIAIETLSSIKTVRKYLTSFGIELRPEDRLQPRMYERFGTKRVKGKLVPSLPEQKAIIKMKALRATGHSYREIVAILNELKFPCRKRGAKWHVKTVYKCLNQSKLKSKLPQSMA